MIAIESFDQHRKVISSGSMTGTSVITGTAFMLRGQSKISYQAVWTGTPNGTFTFQICNHPLPFLDPDGNAVARETSSANSAATWTTITNPSGFAVLQPAGTATSAEFALADVSALWIRPVYTNSSSTGTLNVWAAARF